jgi:hypothetical protein
MYTHTDTHIHTHIHIHIRTYIYIGRERAHAGLDARRDAHVARPVTLIAARGGRARGGRTARYVGV